MAAATDRGIPLSKISPKYLHSNSTSHKWPFSAIAELIDNAYDPDVKAKQLWIDKSVVKGQNCLIFMDNGAGMDYETMHNMLSFGFSNKTTIKGHAPVGQYGNGFKSGSMRLGRDAIVFSKRADTMCVGLLSQTYLEDIKAENVIVPIITFTPTGLSVAPEHEASLQDILKYSLFNKEELLTELRVIGELNPKPSGTRIIIWNLRNTYLHKPEFDFTSDDYDIRIPDDLDENTMDESKQKDRDMLVPESEYSLRAYCSILYQKPRMQIIIRGKKVQAQYVSKSLAHTLKDNYKPSFLNKGIAITFGYNTKSKEHYGIMMYHKNRLIKAYERVACQRKVESTGVGVIGVIECNYLTPTHNKQDFEDTEEYRKTMQSLSNKVEDYWKEMRHRFKEDCAAPVEDNVKEPDQIWVQCDDCLKWRKLPDGINTKKLPDKWFCQMNTDPQYRSCEAEEDPQDDDKKPKYQKTHKKQEQQQKSQNEMNNTQIPSPSTSMTLPTANSSPKPTTSKKRTHSQDVKQKETKRTRAEESCESNTTKSSSTSTASPEGLNLIGPESEGGDALMSDSKVKMEQSDNINELDGYIGQLIQNTEVKRAQIKEEDQDNMQAPPVFNDGVDCRVTELEKKVNSLEDEKCGRCENLEKELKEIKKKIQQAQQSNEDKETQTEYNSEMDIDIKLNTHKDDTQVKKDINEN
ncbi:MORC family CW-type zinc finger protein 3-like isoform X2 [Trichomycterus rosablanca]|uniref:MORC family CW-type zinc finger protein 3-like isoform X2 n=1 Tax=Trichomycterus rosablanca TaxID=2290929 RepID=UPI002F350A5D